MQGTDMYNRLSLFGSSRNLVHSAAFLSCWKKWNLTCLFLDFWCEIYGNVQVDLVGGYYDAGDNVKFGFPMAFTTTMLSWSVIEFGGLMKGELQNARQAIRWATNYLLKATAYPDTIFVQVIYVLPAFCIMNISWTYKRTKKFTLKRC